MKLKSLKKTDVAEVIIEKLKELTFTFDEIEGKWKEQMAKKPISMPLVYVDSRLTGEESGRKSEK